LEHASKGAGWPSVDSNKLAISDATKSSEEAAAILGQNAIEILNL
jgi:hypothetical protein